MNWKRIVILLFAVSAIGAAALAAMRIWGSIDRGAEPALASTAVDSQAYLPLLETGGAPAGWWTPPAGARWQIQFSGEPIDLTYDVDIYDLDLFDTAAGIIADLHDSGKRVFCYISVGSWEDWRPDAGQFPEAVLGSDYEGWPGERWLDIRRLDVLAPIMTARLGQCRDKGFDGVEPDNIDAYTNNTGFPLTYQDQLDYNLWLAEQAHARGLSIGMKNDVEQLDDLLPVFDWALVEDCFIQGWCEELSPFIEAGKAVLSVEYTDEYSQGDFLSQVCPLAQDLQFSAILKHRDLDAWQLACPTE